MNTSEVLNKAADLIEERGWTQGSCGWDIAGTGSSALCLEGGIIAALGSTYCGVDMEALWSCAAYIAVSDYLGHNLMRLPNGDPQEPLYGYNDDEDRTADDVIATLRASALIEAAKENAAVEVRESVTVR